MKQHSDIAWSIASIYSRVLASETRDLAAHIDQALDAVREICASQAEGFYNNPNLEDHLKPAIEIGKVCGAQIAAAIRSLKLPSEQCRGEK